MAFVLFTVLEAQDAENGELLLSLEEIQANLNLQGNPVGLDELERLNEELFKKDFLKKQPVITNSSAVRYVLSRNTAKDPKTVEDTGKRNLRVVIHKLERLAKGQLIVTGKTWLRSVVRSDIEVFQDLLNDDVRSALEVYKAPFLENIELRLSRAGFEIGSSLQLWLDNARSSLAKALQQATLATALQEIYRGEGQQAVSLIETVFVTAQETYLSAVETRLLLALLKAQNSEILHLIFAHLRAQGHEVHLPDADTAQTYLEQHLGRPQTVTPIQNQSKHAPHKFLFNVPRIHESVHFHGRTDIFKELVQVLKPNDTPIIGITGESGIGKTSLVTKLMSDYDAQPQNVATFKAIIYFQFHPLRPYSLLTLIRTIAHTLPQGDTLLKYWATQANLQSKLDYLFNGVLRDFPMLLVWDNLEALAQPTPSWANDLMAFVDAFLGYQHESKLLLISQDQPEFHGAFSDMPVYELGGLSRDETRQFLGDAAPHLSRLQASGLELVYKLTNGKPRALQAVVSVSSGYETEALDALFQDPDFLKKIQQNPFEALYPSLTLDYRRVLAALVIFEEPITASDLQQFVPQQIEMSSVLQDLVRRHLVREVKLTTIAYSLFETDQVFLYQKVTEDFGEAQVIAWHLVAANLHKANVKPSYKMLDDLIPNLQAAHHYIKAQHFEQAFEEIYAIDFDYLHTWGHSDVLVRFYERIAGSLSGKTLVTFGNALGRAYKQLGQYDKAIQVLHEVLRLSSRLGEAELGEKIIGNLGLAHYHTGLYDLALMYFQDGLRRQQALNQLDTQDEYLGFLGLCHYELGDIEAAKSYVKQAAELSHLAKRERSQAIWQGSLAKIMVEDFRLSQRPEILREAEQVILGALGLCRRLGFRASEAANLDNLAQLHKTRSDSKSAIALWSLSHALWSELQSPYAKNVQVMLENELESVSPLQMEELSRTGSELLLKVTGHPYQYAPR
jgi:tetratricopeptide (TPR) repeat protein